MHFECPAQVAVPTVCPPMLEAPGPSSREPQVKTESVAEDGEEDSDDSETEEKDVIHP